MATRLGSVSSAAGCTARSACGVHDRQSRLPKPSLGSLRVQRQPKPNADRLRLTLTGALPQTPQGNEVPLTLIFQEIQGIS